MRDQGMETGGTLGAWYPAPLGIRMAVPRFARDGGVLLDRARISARGVARPEFSHGYFVPFLAVFLFLRQAENLELDSDRQWAGIGVVVLGLTIGLIGNLASIADVVTYGLLTCIAGLLVVVTGFNAGGKALGSGGLSVLHAAAS